ARTSNPPSPLRASAPYSSRAAASVAERRARESTTLPPGPTSRGGVAGGLPISLVTLPPVPEPAGIRRERCDQYVKLIPTLPTALARSPWLIAFRLSPKVSTSKPPCTSQDVLPDAIGTLARSPVSKNPKVSLPFTPS